MKFNLLLTMVKRMHSKSKHEGPSDIEKSKPTMALKLENLGKKGKSLLPGCGEVAGVPEPPSFDLSILRNRKGGVRSRAAL